MILFPRTRHIIGVFGAKYSHYPSYGIISVILRGLHLVNVDGRGHSVQFVNRRNSALKRCHKDNAHIPELHTQTQKIFISAPSGARMEKHFVFVFIEQFVCNYVNALRPIHVAVWASGLLMSCDKLLSISPVRKWFLTHCSAV